MSAFNMLYGKETAAMSMQAQEAAHQLLCKLAQQSPNAVLTALHESTPELAALTRTLAF